MAERVFELSIRRQECDVRSCISFLRSMNATHHRLLPPRKECCVRVAILAFLKPTSRNLAFLSFGWRHKIHLPFLLFHDFFIC